MQLGLFLALVYLSLSCCTSTKMKTPVVLVHGGAGDVDDSKFPAKIAGVKRAASAGYDVLQKGGSVVDAVEAAVRVLEDDPAFNAGYGSVLNEEGDVEMDASLMVGADLSAGAVTAVMDVANPISLARLVMEKTPHVLLAAHGAKKFAKEQGIEILPPGSLVTEEALQSLDEFKKYGRRAPEIFGEKRDENGDTVGAIAVDADGHVAAASSSGGYSGGKMVGRSSSSSLSGGGFYADDRFGGASCTGHGESIMKFCVAHTIIKALESGQDAQEATTKAISDMTAKLNNTAGAITLSKNGDVGIAFSNRQMSWAYQVGDELHYGIEHGQHEIEKV